MSLSDGSAGGASAARIPVASHLSPVTIHAVGKFPPIYAIGDISMNINEISRKYRHYRKNGLSNCPCFQLRGTIIYIARRGECSAATRPNHSRRRCLLYRRLKTIPVVNTLSRRNCLAWPRASVSTLSTIRSRVIVYQGKSLRWETAAFLRRSNTNHPANAGAPPLHPELNAGSVIDGSPRWGQGRSPVATGARDRPTIRSLVSPIGTINQGAGHREPKRKLDRGGGSHSCGFVGMLDLTLYLSTAENVVTLSDEKDNWDIPRAKTTLKWFQPDVHRRHAMIERMEQILHELNARAFSDHSGSYPELTKKFAHSVGVNSSMISAMAAQRSSTVRAAAFLSNALSFEKACSMGLKSGE